MLSRSRSPWERRSYRTLCIADTKVHRTVLSGRGGAMHARAETIAILMELQYRTCYHREYYWRGSPYLFSYFTSPTPRLPAAAARSLYSLFPCFPFPTTSLTPAPPAGSLYKAPHRQMSPVARPSDAPGQPDLFAPSSAAPASFVSPAHRHQHVTTRTPPHYTLSTPLSRVEASSALEL